MARRVLVSFRSGASIGGRMPDDAQGWRIQTIIRHLLTVPVSVSTHARYEVARICIPAGWLRWWRLFVQQ